MPKKQVLIADDSTVVRQILREFLQDRRNLEVCGEAVNGFEAIQSAKKLRPDLILLDLAMPVMNGAEAASVLKKVMPEVPIIVFTMYSENIGRSLTSALGVEVVLSKPDGMRVLVEAIEAFMAGQLVAGKPLEGLGSVRLAGETLAALRPRQPNGEKPVEAGTRAPDRIITVLVADSHEVVRRSIADLLITDPGIRVVGEVTDYAELFKMASALTPDVLLIDTHMLLGGQLEAAPTTDDLVACTKCVLAMSLPTTDNAIRALASRFSAKKILDKNKLFTELIPAIRGYGTGEPKAKPGYSASSEECSIRQPS